MSEMVKVNELFGISEERAKELINKVLHADIDSDDMEGLAEKLNLKSMGEEGFIAYTFGRLVEKNENEK